MRWSIARRWAATTVRCVRLWSTVISCVSVCRWKKQFSIMLLCCDECSRNFTPIKTVKRNLDWTPLKVIHARVLLPKWIWTQNRTNTGLDMWQNKPDENCLHFCGTLSTFLPLSFCLSFAPIINNSSQKSNISWSRAMQTFLLCH